MKSTDVAKTYNEYQELTKESGRIALLILALETKNIDYYVNDIELDGNKIRYYLSHHRYSDDNAYEDIPLLYFNKPDAEIVELETERINKAQFVRDRLNAEKLAEQKRQEELREKRTLALLKAKYEKENV